VLIIVVSRSLLPQRLIGCQFTVIPLNHSPRLHSSLHHRLTAARLQLIQGARSRCMTARAVNVGRPRLRADTANRHRQPPKESSNRQNVYSLPVVCVCHCKILILFAILCWLPGYSDIGCQERQPTLAANNRPSLSARMSQP